MTPRILYAGLAILALSAGLVVTRTNPVMVDIEEGKVISAGYGSINLKHGLISHHWNPNKESADRLTRSLDHDSYVNGTPAEYETVEVFYRKVPTK